MLLLICKLISHDTNWNLTIVQIQLNYWRVGRMYINQEELNFILENLSPRNNRV